MTMKFDTPGQAGIANADFDKLGRWEQAAVLRLVAKARKTSGMHNERLMVHGIEIYAYKRSGDGKIAWGINSEDTGFCTVRGVFPE